MAQNDHQSHTIPHLHVDQHEHHANTENLGSAQEILQSNWLGIEEVSSHDLSLNTEHDSEAHFHVHLHDYLVNNCTPSVSASRQHLPVSLEKTFRSLTHTPPVPPPDTKYKSLN
ncbi:MAG: hypothetical protein OQJ89_06480 [Kangiellaceae bacterium]|nr:hypothetical protein [Kangiellaceae bacterium]MCW8997955.1 hypothetical protein [Kangiellaceae bacterium]MCW9016589.1 hypothetical protein [Kangiellaceae bacterium]